MPLLYLALLQQLPDRLLLALDLLRERLDLRLRGRAGGTRPVELGLEVPGLLAAAPPRCARLRSLLVRAAFSSSRSRADSPFMAASFCCQASRSPASCFASAASFWASACESV